MTQFDAERHLRVRGERQLVAGAGAHPHRHGAASDLVEAARALVALGVADRAVTEAVLADYRLASALRVPGDSGWRRHLRYQHATPPATPVALSPRRTVACRQELQISSQTVRVTSVTVSPAGTSLSVSISWETPARQGHRHPPTFTLADDRGTTTQAHFSGGGDDRSWDGHLQGEALAADTAYLELDGERIELGDDSAPAEVRIEPVPGDDPAHRYLWHRLAATETHQRGAGENPLEAAIEALVAAGLLDAADPVIEAVRELSESGSRSFRAGTDPSELPIPEAWRTLRRSGGPWGFVGIDRQDRGETLVLGAVTPVFAGCQVAIDELSIHRHGFQIELETSPGTNLGGPLNDSLDAAALAWWALDDEGHHYLGQQNGWGGSPDRARGTIAFHGRLGRGVRKLWLMPTGLEERAVIAVPLGGRP